MSEYPEIVYLNGQYLKPHEAKISVFDRGFIFGDGVYEGIAKMNGKLFSYPAHIERLNNGLSSLKIPFDTSMLQGIINELESRSGLAQNDYFIYIQITRGPAPRKHAYPAEIKPSCFAYIKTVNFPDDITPVSVITRPDIRWHRCDIKMTSLLGNVMASQSANNASVKECVLIRDGMITEGSHTNVFFVKGDNVFTHPADNHILNGITRQVVIDLCNKHQIPIVEKAIAWEELGNMDEAFLTGTSSQITPIEQIDKLSFEVTESGITQELTQFFNQMKKS